MFVKLPFTAKENPYSTSSAVLGLTGFFFSNDSRVCRVKLLKEFRTLLNWTCRVEYTAESADIENIFLKWKPVVNYPFNDQAV